MTTTQFSENNNSTEPMGQKKLSFTKWRWVFFFSLLIFLAGCFIIFYPQTLYQSLAYFFGGGLMLSGIYKIFFDTRSTYSGRSLRNHNFLSGGIALILAWVLLLKPDLMIIALPISFGIIFLIFSFLFLGIAEQFAKTQTKWIWLIGGIVFLLALSMFVYPEVWGNILGRVIGIFLVGIGIAGILLSLYLKNMEWDITSLYRNREKDFFR